MKSSNQAAEQEALATLRMFRKQVDVTDLSDEDRATVAKNWATIYDPEPTAKAALGNSILAMAMPLFDPGNLKPQLIPCTLALRAFASAIESGLPGAELETEGFLRDCGFEDAAALEILQQMVSRAPLPDPDTLN